MKRAFGLSFLLACGAGSDGSVSVVNVAQSNVDVDENALILAELDNGQPLFTKGDATGRVYAVSGSSAVTKGLSVSRYMDDPTKDNTRSTTTKT